MKYRYLEDIATADAAFEAWGDTVEEVFISAAEATVNVMVEDLATIEPRTEISFDIENSTLDLLLFDFLNELVFYKDARQLLLRIAALTIGTRADLHFLHAVGRGEQIEVERHQPSADVKAVTLHRFSLVETAVGWKATVVLDI